MWGAGMSDALFAIPGLWEPTTLGESCRRGGGDIQTGPFGSQLHASDYVPCGIPSIMPQNIGDNRISEDGIARITADDALRLSRYLVRCGDIVYSRRGDVERRALIREREDGWLCGTGCLRIRFGNGVVHPPYVAFYLGHPLVRQWIVRHAHGATMPNLNTSILSALPFVLPPLEEQRAIAHILGTLDDKIELNRRTNETLEAMARAIFKSWFVDFDPVRAKASGETPESICRRLGLTTDLLTLFPDDFVESELGEIPQEWPAVRLDTILELAYGKALKAGDRVGGMIPVYGSGGVTGYHNKHLVEGPSIVVGRKGTVGSLYWEDRASYPIDTVFYVKPIVQIHFCYYLLQTLGLETMNTDAAVPGLNRNNVYRLLVPLPSGSLRHAFDAAAKGLRDRVSANIEESAILMNIRDSLLPRLLSGDLDARPVSHEIEAMA